MEIFELRRIAFGLRCGRCDFSSLARTHWASFQRASHSNMNFTRSFIAPVAFQGIAGLSAMSLCNRSHV
ncbi:MAG TPA: hypothetical protein VH083_15595 [Myxococcales bacterium]|nr:hypothetical protein [Myxococcales bacterium]